MQSRRYGYLPRFPRLQLIHELLWQLVYGQLTQNTSDIIDVDGHKSTAEQQVDCANQVTRNMDDEWINHLKPMSKLCDEARQPLPGWFRMADVLLVMPLDILCKIMDVPEEVTYKISCKIKSANFWCGLFSCYGNC